MDELTRSRAVFVQPHLDDVGLSCGGTVARAADRGDQPVVLGVFTGPPTSGTPFSATVRALHAQWGLGDDAWLARRREDERACAILGAAPMWLAFQDAPYRGYDSFRAMFGGLSDDDPLIQQVADELASVWRQTPRATLYLPLGVGGHIDHAICHATGARLEAEGVPVAYYEDFPYAAVPGLVGARLARLGAAFVAELVDITAWIDRRVRATWAYASQVAAMFTGPGLVPGPLDQAMRRRAGAIAGGLPGSVTRGPQFAECFYRRVGAPGGESA